MQKVYRAGTHYRERAEECRTIAEMMHGDDPREKMRRVAADYERMAEAADMIREDVKSC